MNDTSNTSRWSAASLGSLLSAAARPRSLAKRLVRDYARKGYQPLAELLGTYPSPLVIDREELQAICRREGMLSYYGTSKAVELTVPQVADGPAATIARRAGEHLVPTPFISELPGVTLIGRYPLPIYGRRVVLEAVGREDIALLNVLYSITEGSPAWTTSATQSIDRAVLLHNCWSGGYFHWVTENLTRLEGLEQYRERTGEEPTLLIGPNPSGFRTESLELLGYEEGDWIEWDGTTTTIDRLVVPSMRRGTTRSSETGPIAHEWLRDRLRAAAAERVDSDRFSPRVYVSRADADRRRIVNEPAVRELLGEYGFETYRLAEMSVAENVALFAGAECVVAPHGAGLTNLLFAEDASVVELARSNYSSTYSVLAQSAGHEHHYLECEPRGVDLVVDPAALESALADALTAKRVED
jgi:capsular polysaccharide biosynthesis protein